MQKEEICVSMNIFSVLICVTEELKNYNLN